MPMDMMTTTDKAAAAGLGVASLAIGLTEIAAPKALEDLMGLGNGANTRLLRLMGLREIMHGVGILTSRDPAPAVWSRVAGDAVDLALLGAAARQTTRPTGLAFATAAVLGITALDVLVARRLSRE
jgi:hypothetical protein